ncbi:MAG: DNA repair exonuclease [Actinomycetota bacterium]
MARFVAFGDAHLGRSHLAHLRDDLGRNLREEDFLRSFAWAVRTTIELEPDGFLLLGDLFDHARPTYRTFSKVLVGLKELNAAGLTGVAISGNHDTPRVRGTGSPYAALEEIFPNVSFAWNLQARSVDLAGVRVHAVPQTLTVADFREQLAQASGEVRSDATNVLLAHVALTSLPSREWRDINELELEEGAFDKRFDQVLLGHYHVFQKVSKRTWYAGSTDSFTFADVPSGSGPKGLVILDTDAGAIEHVPNPGERPLVTFGVATAGLGAGEILSAVAQVTTEVPDGAVVRVYLNEVDPAAFRQIPREGFAELVPNAVHVQAEPDFGPEAFAVQGGPEIGSLESEWATYVETQDLTGLERDRVVEAGRRFLEEARGDTV